MKNTKDYIQRKIDHMNRFGIQAMRSPTTGAATTQAIIEENERQSKRTASR